MAPVRRFAYNLMEEALATVAGEWLYAQQAGQPEAGEWRHDDYINRYAHALYLLMPSYVARGQEIDSAFVAQAIMLFDSTFPRATTEYTNLFRNTLYWTDSDGPQAIEQAFCDQFRSTFTYTVTPIVAQARGLEKARCGEYLPIIVVTRQHAATLRYPRQQLPALRGQRLNPAQSFVLSTTGPAEPIIVARNDRRSSYHAAPQTHTACRSKTHRAPPGAA